MVTSDPSSFSGQRLSICETAQDSGAHPCPASSSGLLYPFRLLSPVAPDFRFPQTSCYMCRSNFLTQVPTVCLSRSWAKEPTNLRATNLLLAWDSVHPDTPSRGEMVGRYPQVACQIQDIVCGLLQECPGGHTQHRSEGSQHEPRWTK